MVIIKLSDPSNLREILEDFKDVRNLYVRSSIQMNRQLKNMFWDMGKENSSICKHVESDEEGHY